jgi:hypothetical protein
MLHETQESEDIAEGKKDDWSGLNWTGQCMARRSKEGRSGKRQSPETPFALELRCLGVGQERESFFAALCARYGWKPQARIL